MKRIVALIRPDSLTRLKGALREVDAEQVRVCRRNPHPDTRVYMAPNLRVEIITTDSNAETVFHVICKALGPYAARPANDVRAFILRLEDSAEEPAELAAGAATT
jgi:nitrogen regulatory protein PII